MNNKEIKKEIESGVLFTLKGEWPTPPKNEVDSLFKQLPLLKQNPLFSMNLFLYHMEKEGLCIRPLLYGRRVVFSFHIQPLRSEVFPLLRLDQDEILVILTGKEREVVSTSTTGWVSRLAKIMEDKGISVFFDKGYSPEVWSRSKSNPYCTAK